MKWVRRSVVFILGLVLMYDSLANQFRIVEFIAGAVMVGLIPIDTIIDLLMQPAKDDTEIDRLREVMERKDEEK
jgi:hypothetical protein